jgi:hypothetical protein
MHTRLASTLAVALASAALFGCPSKEGEHKDAQTSSGVTPPAAGPLASLESSAFVNEVWVDEGGQKLPFLYYTRENLRVSAQCRNPAGQIACDAMRFLRSGTPVDMAKRALDGRTSAGVKVCRKMNQQIVVLHNTVGAEDSMCRFPDGSLLSNGALEQYGMRIIE